MCFVWLYEYFFRQRPQTALIQAMAHAMDSVPEISVFLQAQVAEAVLLEIRASAQASMVELVIVPYHPHW
jgi:hypothetical protein